VRPSMSSNAFRLAGAFLACLLVLVLLIRVPDIEVLIVTPGSASYALNRVLYEINQARSSIDLAMFLLTNDAIIRALRQKHREGVRVSVLYGDTSHFPGVKVYGLHMKLMVIDKVRVVVGSANFTEGAFGNNTEILIFMNSTEFNSYFGR
jgi:phosphatidylserine/phosphatidylglycerophosphate/cardiolipin synthase-like enzyme